MSTTIVHQPTSALASIEEIAEQARDYARGSKAHNTWRAYGADWRHFEAWCQTHRRTALPAAPETVALYLSAIADAYKPSTLQRRMSAISQAHQAAQLETPTQSLAVRAVMAGIRRAKGT